MTDDDHIRLTVIAAVLATGESASAAWDAGEYILDRWHHTQPYAPPFKCAHGKLATEECIDCAKPDPVIPDNFEQRPTVVIGVEP